MGYKEYLRIPREFKIRQPFSSYLECFNSQKIYDTTELERHLKKSQYPRKIKKTIYISNSNKKIWKVLLSVYKGSKLLTYLVVIKYNRPPTK